MYQKFKERKPYELLDTSKYPPEVAGRFNSFITTQFDDSLSVEMQMRSVIKWAIDNFDLMDKTYNDFTEYILNGNINPFIEMLNDLIEYMNYFIDEIDNRLAENIVVKLDEWLDDGTLADIINNDVFDMKADKTFVDSEIDRLNQEDERITAQLAQKVNKSQLNDFSLNVQQTTSSSNLSGSSPKIIYKEDDNTLRVITKNPRGYVTHKFERNRGGNGLGDTGGSHELLRVTESVKSPLTYLIKKNEQSHQGDLTVIQAGDPVYNDFERQLGNLTYLSKANHTGLSNHSDNSGLEVRNLKGAEGTRPTINYRMTSMPADKKMNVLYWATATSTTSVNVLVNGRIVANFNPRSNVPVDGTGQHIGLFEFDVPFAQGLSKDYFNVIFENMEPTSHFYIVGVNYSELKDYTGADVDTFKAIVNNEYYLLGSGASDYALFDHDTQKWLGSYHGGETSVSLRFDGFNSFNFTHGNRVQSLDFETQGGEIPFHVLDHVLIEQQTQLTTADSKSAIMSTQYTLSTDGTIQMDFHLSDNNINTETIYTALTSTHKDFDRISYPKRKSFANQVGTGNQITTPNNTGHVVQQTSTGLRRLGIHFTKFSQSYQEPKTAQGGYVWFSDSYNKFYYGAVVEFSEGVVVPELSFSKILDFY